MTPLENEYMLPRAMFAAKVISLLTQPTFLPLEIHHPQEAAASVHAEAKVNKEFIASAPFSAPEEQSDHAVEEHEIELEKRSLRKKAKPALLRRISDTMRALRMATADSGLLKEMAEKRTITKIVSVPLEAAGDTKPESSLRDFPALEEIFSKAA